MNQLGLSESLKILCIPKPNGFADQFPYEKWL